MLTENDVVDSLTDYLQAKGYRIIQSLSTSEKGVDIIAELKGQTLYIEAKGETSSKEGTKRFGKPFTNSQINTHVSRAILTAMKILESQPSGDQTISGIALPDTNRHNKLINSVKTSLQQLNIQIFWINQKGVRLGG